jgi:hypothetical protein
MVLIVFDTETTSLDPKSNRIVSIAASCGDAEFYTLVNPRCPIPRASTKIHGITNAEAARAPPWAVAGIRFWRWVEQVRTASLPLTPARAALKPGVPNRSHVRSLWCRCRAVNK